MTTDIADMIEKDTAVPQGNDGIFNFFKNLQQNGYLRTDMVRGKEI